MVEFDCCLLTLRSVDITGAGSGENRSPANGDGGGITGTGECSDGPEAKGEGGDIFTSVGTALGPFTTTGLGVLDLAVVETGSVPEAEVVLDTAVAMCGLLPEEAVFEYDDVVMGFDCGCSLVGDVFVR